MIKYLILTLFPILALAGTFRADNIIDNGLSTTQAVVSDGSKQLTSMIYTPSVTNSSIASRDSNGNTAFNNSAVAVTATVTSGQIITMSAGSTGRQRATGSANITYNMPDASTMYSGQFYYFNNSSTGTVTINRQDGTTLITTLGAGGIILVVCLDNSTVQGVWGVAPWLSVGSSSSTSGTLIPGNFTATGLATNSVVFTDANHTLYGGSFSGDANNSGSTITIQPGVVTNAKLANMNNSTIKCNVSGSSGAPQDCTMGQAATAINSVLGALIGPAASATAGAVLTSNGTAWVNSVVPVPACVALAGTSIDWSLGNCFTKTLSANTTFTFLNKIGGQTIQVRTTNPAGFTVTWPNTNSPGASVLWAGSTVPTASTLGHRDIWSVFFDGTEMYGSPVSNY